MTFDTSKTDNVADADAPEMGAPTAFEGPLSFMHASGTSPTFLRALFGDAPFVLIADDDDDKPGAEITVTVNDDADAILKFLSDYPDAYTRLTNADGANVALGRVLDGNASDGLPKSFHYVEDA